MKIRAVGGGDNDNHQQNHRKESLFKHFTIFKMKLNELNYTESIQEQSQTHRCPRGLPNFTYIYVHDSSAYMRA